MTYLTTRRPMMRNLFNLHNQMDQVFSTLFASHEGETDMDETSWMPTADISETENGFEIRVELPGVSENDVNVSVTDNLLTIKGEKHQEAETDGKNYHRVERRYGRLPEKFHVAKTHRNRCYQSRIQGRCLDPRNSEGGSRETD